MKKLLISGLGGSLFPYLIEKLENKYKLFFVDYNENLSKIYKKLNFISVPLVTDNQYSFVIKNIIKRYKIDYYIPLIDEELVVAKRQIENFQNLTIISPQLDFIELCLNKYELMKKLQNEGLSNIPTFLGSNFQDSIKLPLFLKPVYGRGSRGIQKINKIEQIEAYYTLENRSPSDTLIQPYIAGTEYTVGVTVNNLNDILAISSKRIICKKGITQAATTENNKIITKIVIQVVQKLKPCGPINIQLFITPNSEVKIFEINPRFSTTSIMEYEGGLDLIGLFIEFKDKKFLGDFLTPREGINLYRRWESIFYEN